MQEVEKPTVYSPTENMKIGETVIISERYFVFSNSFVSYLYHNC